VKCQWSPIIRLLIHLCLDCLEKFHIRQVCLSVEHSLIKVVFQRKFLYMIMRQVWWERRSILSFRFPYVPKWALGVHSWWDTALAFPLIRQATGLWNLKKHYRRWRWCFRHEKKLMGTVLQSGTIQRTQLVSVSYLQ